MEEYKFVKITFTGEKDAVKALIRMYFGHLEYTLVNNKDQIDVIVNVPVSIEEIEAELDEGTI